MVGLLSCVTAAGAQPTVDTVHVTHEEAETIFLQRNLRLLAAKLEIDEAKAQVIQAKLWPNPTLAIDEVNLWSNHGAEALGRLSGSWGNHAQIAVDIEQVIQTAGKRRKLMAAEEAGVRVAEQQFEDMLRSLKVELRSQLAELDYAQQREQTYRQVLAQLRKLLQAYQRQVALGNVSQSEYMRLKASEAALNKEIADIRRENREAQQALKVLLGIAPASELVLSGSRPYGNNVEIAKTLQAVAILEWADAYNAELQALRWEVTQAEHQLRYEQAQRTPDVAVNIGYDRGGNIMRDFIGVGVSMDLPLFNRNQGNIRAAQAAVEKHRLLAQEKKIAVGSAAIQAWKSLLMVIDQREQFGPDDEAEMDKLLEGFHHSFAERRVSLLEYLDFLEAYLDTKDYILETNRDSYIHYENLRYYVGDQLP